MSRLRVALVLLAVTTIAAACGREGGLRCMEDTRYASSTTAPPLRIPDDLTIPDETEALRIPDEPLGSADDTSDLPCLESAPDFFEGQGDE